MCEDNASRAGTSREWWTLGISRSRPSHCLSSGRLPLWRLELHTFLPQVPAWRGVATAADVSEVGFSRERASVSASTSLRKRSRCNSRKLPPATPSSCREYGYNGRICSRPCMTMRQKPSYSLRRRIKQWRSWHLVPSLRGKQMGKRGKQWKTLFSWAPKSLWMVTAAMKLKDACSLEEKLWPT